MGAPVVAFNPYSSVSVVGGKASKSNRLDGVYDDVNGILYHKYGVTVEGKDDSSFSLVSAAVTPELLQTLEARSRSVYLCGIAWNEVVDVGQKLGEGSFGVVSKVLHTPTNRILALKRLPLKDDPEYRQAVARELRLMYRCHSPFIVQFHGAFYWQGRVSFCMEYMTAGSLRDLYYAGGALDESSLKLVAKSVLEAMVYLCERDIMHRDIKPDNILLGFNGEVKLADLGIGVILSDEIAQSAVGTQVYLAPERFEHSSANRYTHVADMWSLGISLLELATGRYPYPVEDVDAYEAEHGPRTRGERPPRLDAFGYLGYLQADDAPGIPKARFSPLCQDFVSLCLRKDPAARPEASDLLGHPFLHNLNVPDAHARMAKRAQLTLGSKFVELLEDMGEHPTRYDPKTYQTELAMSAKAKVTVYRKRRKRKH